MGVASYSAGQGLKYILVIWTKETILKSMSKNSSLQSYNQNYKKKKKKLSWS